MQEHLGWRDGLWRTEGRDPLGGDCWGRGGGGALLCHRPTGAARQARGALTQEAEDHWQEDQAVQQAQQGDEEVEAEEEDLDELRFGQAQDEDAWQIGHGHSREHLGVTGGHDAGCRVEGWGLQGVAGPLTALPMKTVASLALSSRVSRVLMAKARVMWDTNSTEMPTAWGQKGALGVQAWGAGSREGSGVSGACARYRDQVDEGHSIVADAP